jgi:hypothetical protein
MQIGISALPSLLASSQQAQDKFLGNSGGNPASASTSAAQRIQNTDAKDLKKLSSFEKASLLSQFLSEEAPEEKIRIECLRKLYGAYEFSDSFKKENRSLIDKFTQRLSEEIDLGMQFILWETPSKKGRPAKKMSSEDRKRTLQTINLIQAKTLYDNNIKAAKYDFQSDDSTKISTYYNKEKDEIIIYNIESLDFLSFIYSIINEGNYRRLWFLSKDYMSNPLPKIEKNVSETDKWMIAQSFLQTARIGKPGDEDFFLNPLDKMATYLRNKFFEDLKNLPQSKKLNTHGIRKTPTFTQLENEEILRRGRYP